MFWFKRKKKYIYKIAWRYSIFTTIQPIIEYVKATDEWNAWQQIKKEYGGIYDLTCEYIEKIKKV